MVKASNGRQLVTTASVLAVVLFATRARTQQPTNATVVSVERVSGRAVYKVDSQRVGDLLSAFNGIASRQGNDHPVVVLIDPAFPISELWNVDGVAGKAQLTNLRFFVAFRDTEMMSEIKRLPAIRIGTPIQH